MNEITSIRLTGFEGSGLAFQIGAQALSAKSNEESAPSPFAKIGSASNEEVQSSNSTTSMTGEIDFLV